MTTATSTNRRIPGSPAANQYGEFSVKYGTDRQARFATRLAAERDTSGVENLPEDFTQVNKRHISDWIDLLLQCPVKQGAPRTDEASPKQVELIKKLAGEKDWEDLAGGEDYAAITTVLAGQPITKKQARVIDWLFTLRRKPAPVDPAAAVLEDAMYLKDGVILKVYHTVHGANQQVAKRLCVEVIAAAKEAGALDQLAADDKWEYLGKRGLAGLTAGHRMSLEQAKELGAVYGVCVRCGATLTNEVSIEKAMGPVCRGKF